MKTRCPKSSLKLLPGLLIFKLPLLNVHRSLVVTGVLSEDVLTKIGTSERERNHLRLERGGKLCRLLPTALSPTHGHEQQAGLAEPRLQINSKH